MFYLHLFVYIYVRVIVLYKIDNVLTNYKYYISGNKHIKEE